MANLYYKFKHFVRCIFQEEFTEQNIEFIKKESVSVIKAFIEESKKIHPDVQVTPKLHHFIHIGESIQHFGPLKHTMTLRHERKHQISKNHYRSVRSSRNIEASILTREIDFLKTHTESEENKNRKFNLQKNIVLPFIGTSDLAEVTSFLADDKAIATIYEFMHEKKQTKTRFYKLKEKSRIIDLNFESDLYYIKKGIVI